MKHIIPDVHGQADKLDALLAHLGWRRAPSGWHAPDPDREIVFLGDFIDRGPENARVLRTVRSLVDSGKACAVMGNHEFNAIHFHTEVDGVPLRARSEKNVRQHASFLAEFPVGAAETREMIAWMQGLPLAIETGGLRAVHACWHTPAIETLRRAGCAEGLSDEMLHRPGWTSGAVWDALQIVTSGIEVPLPEGASFNDKDGHARRDVRIGWWLGAARTWAGIARSVPDPSVLPETPLPANVAAYRYTDRVPVFFGHYWLSGTPTVDALFALCLDYSAGTDGPLVAYDFTPDGSALAASRIVVAR